MDFQGKNILVVGGSGVLGGLLASRLSELGASVLCTATSNESASRIPETAALRLLLDLENSQSIEVLSEYLRNNYKLDGIVLASGRVGFGSVEETSDENFRKMQQVNFLGPAQLFKSLANSMNEDSFIVAINGVVAEKTFPGMSAYCASKTALSSWLNAARSEFKRKKIQIVDALPGHTETGLAGRPMFGVSPNMPTGMTSEHVVQVILAGIQNKAQVITSAEFSEQ
jgi:cyclic-di-GMP-binding biofilm dispersal mediator protein